MFQFPVTDECKSTFTAIKTKQEHAFAIMKIKDRKEIVLEKLAEPLPDHTQETNEKVFNQMKQDILNLGEPCYIIFDVRFQRKSGFMKDVVGYIFWYVIIMLSFVKKKKRNINWKASRAALNSHKSTGFMVFNFF